MFYEEISLPTGDRLSQAVGRDAVNAGCHRTTSKEHGKAIQHVFMFEPHFSCGNAALRPPGPLTFNDGVGGCREPDASLLSISCVGDFHAGIWAHLSGDDAGA